ncbi:TPA: hypothetical protein I8622_002110 [Klebsiella oxytoca]|uniref:PerC family transcriptional regulator n=1 Tax=Klebsiella oxytoca TaxID=571 RepID=A0AAD3UPR9_KLEOX|nr:hypothetical protein [Klebsiella oxytoca]MBL6088513.1 hypothetical protein [Klebsiella oxytoca]MBL6253140.1 hypothetical protein [Klebsiella oxytoca]MBL6274521.1 hypothetical protein [Klebsiella oxytoca]MDU2890044.1 hypothetical protein [Klebsiella oxytoca]MEC6026023.1 hypothetical protein [Klebsiella oxytoca]
MSIAKSVFEFIEKNPGKMLRDIIAAFPGSKPVTVKSAVHRMYYDGKLSSLEVPGGFIYCVSGAADLEEYLPGGVSPEILELEVKAKKLEEKRYYRRAATVWQQLCDSNCTAKARERYMRLKNASLRSARTGKITGGEM